MIKPAVDPEKMKHVAYADDLGGGSTLEELRNWWDKCCQHGPDMGYHPKAEKSWLIVKPEKMDRAKELFDGTRVKITAEGRKYLGGHIGSVDGTEKYVGDLVEKWVGELKTLSKIASSEPQAAYSCFTAGFRHKVTYFIRTIPNLQDIMAPLDEIIDNQFIPAITEGHHCSVRDRKLLSLPVRLGGMGIPIFSEICNREYQSSRNATAQLRHNIQTQSEGLELDRNMEREAQNNIRKDRTQIEKELLAEVRRGMSKEELRANDLAQLKGASAWLNALPLASEGYVLNKREFFDAVTMRYQWGLKRLPIHCVCGKKFDSQHANTCNRGGFIMRRHNNVRDMLAEMIDDVACDVRIEPPLQPLTGEVLQATGANREDEARLDVAARDFWQRGEMAFFDVRIFNPFAKTHLDQKLDTVFKNQEALKKAAYNERVIRVEHGSFTPVVISAFGGFGRETGKFVSRLTEKISEKHDIPTSIVSNYIRTKVSFELIRSQVMCIRGSRVKRQAMLDVNECQVVDSTSRVREA